MLFHFLVSLFFIVNSVNGQPQEKTLREAGGERGLFMGAAGNYYHFNSDQEYFNLFGSQYNMIYAENGCKWSTIQPQHQVFDFTQCDGISSYSAQFNMTFRGHNLCWGRFNPSWLADGSWTPEEKRSILSNHVETVISRYPNAYAWDVVNEAVNDFGTGYRVNDWYPDVPDYVQLAFTTARNVVGDSVKLIYNDFNILYDSGWMKSKSDAVFNLTRKYKEQGVLDGVGFQVHLSIGDYPIDMMSMRRNIQRYQDIGVEVHITEMDICCSPRCRGCSDDPIVEVLQAKMFQDALSVCLEFPTTCKLFGMWGFSDKYTWRGSDNFPLAFDIDYQPKTAVSFMLDALTYYYKEKEDDNNDNQDDEIEEQQQEEG